MMPRQTLVSFFVVEKRACFLHLDFGKVIFQTVFYLWHKTLALFQLDSRGKTESL